MVRILKHVIVTDEPLTLMMLDGQDQTWTPEEGPTMPSEYPTWTLEAEGNVNLTKIGVAFVNLCMLPDVK